MIDIIRSIKKLAIGMRVKTSKNDSHYEMLQDQIDLCDEAIEHHLDDGR